MKKSPLKNLIQKLSEMGLESLEGLNLFSRDSRDQLASLCTALLQLKGEAASVTIAEEILSLYKSSDQSEKTDFFLYLLNSLPADSDAIVEAIRGFQDDPSQLNILSLNKATESPRLELLRALNMANKGTRTLLAMRADLLKLLSELPELDILDQDFLHLFRSWFNRGFLELRTIDWQTPAAVLEKLIAYESVHEIKGWPDLRRRLEEDRRCFAFFHPVMPDEPLIFVEVALTNSISDNIGELLNQPAPDTKNIRPEKDYSTAIFYSINNCLVGLRGVSFGNLLIKQVVGQLCQSIPSINTFATLSPVPRFNQWLARKLADNNALPQLDETTRTELQHLLEKPVVAELHKNDRQGLMTSLCAQYLLTEKSRAKPADPVARFHLGNGATLEKINWLADDSDNGLQQSSGIMVNYVYDLKTMTRNHEAYEQHHQLAYSNEVKKLLPKS